MSITYEANLNCDGKDCKTRPITTALHESYVAKNIVLQIARAQDWVFIKGEHYCPDCAEIFKVDK